MDVNVSPAKTQVRFADAGTAYPPRLPRASHSALSRGKEERRLRSVLQRDPLRRRAGRVLRRGPRSAAAPRRAGPGAAPPVRAPPAAPAEKRPPEIVRDRAAPRVLHPRVGPRGSARDRPARRPRADPLRAHPGPHRFGAGSLAAAADARALRGDAGGGGDARPRPSRTSPPRGSRSSRCRAAPTPSRRCRRKPPTAIPETHCTRRSPLWPSRARGCRADGATGWRPALACRSAVTIRYHLAPEEIRRLLLDWVKTADRFTCPHGRPVVLSMTEEDLEKYFKRR